MKPRNLFLAAVGVALMASVVLATTWSWNERLEPPDLGAAYVKALKFLGDDARKYHCVGAHLLGNKEGDGKEGAWNFVFASKDGKRTIVAVDMDGTISRNGAGSKSNETSDEDENPSEGGGGGGIVP